RALVAGPPRAQIAIPPPSRNGTWASRSAPAARLRLSLISRNGCSSAMGVSLPFRGFGQSRRDAGPGRGRGGHPHFGGGTNEAGGGLGGGGAAGAAPPCARAPEPR